MRAELVTKTYIRCPACKTGEAQISHLFDAPPHDFGPWYCDRCGAGFRGTVIASDHVELRMCDGPPSRKVVDVLVLDPQNIPLYVAVSSNDYGLGLEGKAYLYDEHSCPTNWTSGIRMLMIGEDADPHGLFRYLGTRVVPEDFFDDADDDSAVAEVIKSVKAEVAQAEAADMAKLMNSVECEKESDAAASDQAAGPSL